jgi:hypothetical protein
MPPEILPLWARSFAWSASHAGVDPDRATAGVDPCLRVALRAEIRSLGAGSPRERVAALLQARNAWRSSGVEHVDRIDEALGTRIMASILAGLPASARAAIVRTFDGASLGGVMAARRSTRSCDPWALVRILDRFTMIARAAPTSRCVGELARGALCEDTGLSPAVERTLRSLRAVGVRSSGPFEPFAADLADLRRAGSGA